MINKENIKHTFMRLNINVLNSETNTGNVSKSRQESRGTLHQKHNVQTKQEINQLTDNSSSLPTQ